MKHDHTSLKIVKAAGSSHQGGNIDEKVETSNELAFVDPADFCPNYRLGQWFYINGDLEKCLEPLTQAAKSNSQFKKCALLYKNNASKIMKVIDEATAETIAGNFSKGIEILATATLIDQFNVPIKQKIRDISNDFLEKFQKNLKPDVRCSQAMDKEEAEELSNLVSRGAFEYYQGCLKQSLVYFEKAFEIDDNLPEVRKFYQMAEKLVELIEHATSKMKVKDNKAAVQLLSQALVVDPHNRRIAQAIYFQRAACKFFMDEKDDAFNDYLQFEALQNKTGMIMDGIKF